MGGGNSQRVGVEEKKVNLLFREEAGASPSIFLQKWKTIYITKHFLQKPVSRQDGLYTFLCLKVESYNKKSLICFLEKRQARLLQHFYRNEKLYVLLNIFLQKLVENNAGLYM